MTSFDPKFAVTKPVTNGLFEKQAFVTGVTRVTGSEDSTVLRGKPSDKAVTNQCQSTTSDTVTSTYIRCCHVVTEVWQRRIRTVTGHCRIPFAVLEPALRQAVPTPDPLPMPRSTPFASPTVTGRHPAGHARPATPGHPQLSGCLRPRLLVVKATIN